MSNSSSTQGRTLRPGTYGSIGRTGLSAERVFKNVRAKKNRGAIFFGVCRTGVCDVRTYVVQVGCVVPPLGIGMYREG